MDEELVPKKCRGREPEAETKEPVVVVKRKDLLATRFPELFTCAA